MSKIFCVYLITLISYRANVLFTPIFIYTYFLHYFMLTKLRQ